MVELYYKYDNSWHNLVVITVRGFEKFRYNIKKLSNSWTMHEKANNYMQRGLIEKKCFGEIKMRKYWKTYDALCKPSANETCCSRRCIRTMEIYLRFITREIQQLVTIRKNWNVRNFNKICLVIIRFIFLDKKTT